MLSSRRTILIRFLKRASRRKIGGSCIPRKCCYYSSTGSFLCLAVMFLCEGFEEADKKITEYGKLMVPVYVQMLTIDVVCGCCYSYQDSSLYS